MRGRWPWVFLLLSIAACLGIAYAAYQLAGYSWEQVVAYKSPYMEGGQALQASGPAPDKPLTKRVVLVIVDGMRLDVSRERMSYLKTMRQYGADLTLTVPQPSLSYPNWTTILTGAPQTISGVTTNWFDTKVAAPTLMQEAEQAGKRVAVIGPEDFATLYGVKPGATVSLRKWPKNGYLSTTLVDDAIRILKAADPELMVVHLPDLDEAGHGYGGASDQYRGVAAKIDVDIQRLVAALGSDSTVIVTADHGHIDTGGHGGYEKVATEVPFVMTGPGSVLGVGVGRLEQVAPTVAVLLGMRDPAFASGTALRSVISTDNPRVFASDVAHHQAFVQHYVDVVGVSAEPVKPSEVSQASLIEAADARAAAARDTRVANERMERLPYAAGLALAALAVFVLVGFASGRALLAALAGTAAYYALYNLLFFVVHRFLWSLSAFNTETNVKAFMNGRMVEAIIAGLVGALVAAAVYGFSRKEPKGPQVRGFLGGWLTLGPTTVLAIQATLALQVAWFLWAYGPQVTWNLPDFMWAFKYDLDLVQVTALGAAALLAPLVTYVMGRYHPRVRKPAEE